MAWEDYTKWVMMKFGSRLSLNQALDALDKLRQTTSTFAYSAKFNTLVSSISNLEDYLKALTDLVKINNNLMLLQQQAEYLDDIAFHSTGKSGRKNITVTAASRTTSPFNQPKAIPSKTPSLTPPTLWTLETLNSKPPCTHASCQNKKHFSDPKDGVFIAKPKTMTLATAPSSRTVKPSSPPSPQQELTMPQLKPKVRKTVKTKTKHNCFTPLAFKDPPNQLTAITVLISPVQIPRPKLPLYHVKSEYHAPYSDSPGLLICQGTIDNNPVSILIDSGANPSFICANLLFLQDKSLVPQDCKIKLADGPVPDNFLEAIVPASDEPAAKTSAETHAKDKAAREALPLKIQELMSKYLDVFSPFKGLPPSKPTDMKIDLDPSASKDPPYRPIYPMSAPELKALQEELTYLLKHHCIRPSTLPF
ncbi:hypothetical protein HDU77_010054, partial [Chytriomyces hyalinus]